MVKLVIFLMFSIFFILILSSITSSQTRACELGVSLLNQDPYPASPGEELKVVFQVTGAGNPQCRQVSLTLKEEFPFSLKPGTPATKSILSSTFSTFEFSSTWQVPYKLITDNKALDGENKITVELGSIGTSFKIYRFALQVETLTSDFEITVKDYVPETNTLIFEILNTGESDVEALTIDLPIQQNLKVKGSTRNIIGGLDSNEDTTFSYEATPLEGDLTIEILYTDKNNVRRALQKTVIFTPELFEDRARDKNGPPITLIIISVIVIIVIIIWIRRTHKKKKRNHHQHHRDQHE